MTTIARVSGEALTLFPERAAFWARRRTLLVADLHFGKAAAFRAGGIPVPTGTTEDGLQRLDTLIERTKASRLVLLGDFLHAREGRAPDTVSKLSRWRARRATLEVLLVRGNHDYRAGDLDVEFAASCVDAPFSDPPFVFAHRPLAIEGAYVLAGHVHPGVRLSGAARQGVRLPCFWFAETVGVLPAFGDFTGLACIEARNGDQVFVVADGVVVSV